jgi:hypothetical protein
MGILVCGLAMLWIFRPSMTIAGANEAIKDAIWRLAFGANLEDVISRSAELSSLSRGGPEAGR